MVEIFQPTGDGGSGGVQSIVAGVGISVNDTDPENPIVSTNDSEIDHNALDNLTVGDPHTQYAFLTGRSGGQTLNGGTASGNDLTLFSTSNATKGTTFFDVASANAIPVSGGANVDPYVFIGQSDAPYLYVNRNDGSTHIGWGAAYTAGSFTYRNSHRFYFDTDFNGSGIKGTYMEAVPTDPGGQQQFKINTYVDGTLQFSLSGVAGVIMPNGFTAGDLLLSGNTLRGTNGSQINFRGESNYVRLYGEKNSAGDYDVWLTGRAIGGGSTVSNLVGIFNDTTVQAYFTPNGGLILNETGANTDSRFEGDTDPNLFYLDASTDRIGIGTATPAYKFDVVGDVNASGVYRSGGTAGVSGTFTTVDLKTVTVTNGIITSIV